MEWFAYIVAAIFVLLGGACVVLVALSLPGGWIMLGLAVLIELVDTLYLPAERAQTFPWWVLIACFVLLLCGELLEFLAGALGAKHGGGSKAGMVGALVGGIVGAFTLASMLIVIPGIGPIIGVLLGALLGTFLGAVIGEIGVARQTVRGSMRPAMGATIGRLLGTTGKIAVTLAIWITLSIAAFWH